MPHPPQAPPRDRPTPPRDHWLIGRYWAFELGLVVLAAPLLVVWGDAPDAWAIGVFGALTAAGWLAARRYPDGAVWAHLLMLIPYWTWYSALPGGIPLELGRGVGDYVVMLVVPVITLTVLARRRSAVIATVVTLLCILWRWDTLEDRAVAFFMVTMVLMFGLVFRRLASRYRATEEAMRHMAYHDPLTGLANRREISEWFDRSLAQGSGALCYLDLDRFKTINDVMGHAAGDVVLKEIVRRVESHARDGQLLARFGGDEFLLAHPGDVDEASLVAQSEAILASINAPIEIGDRIVHVGGSIGIARWPEEGRSFDALLHAADAAMYRAKQDGGGVGLAERVSQTVLTSQRNLEVELWEATSRGELRLVYQPVIDVRGGHIAGVEALVRWTSPVFGAVSPTEFIPLAEETGHVVEIDCWVMETALREIAAWSRRGFDGWVAINVSARSIRDARWMAKLRKLAGGRRDVARRIVLEVTETATVRDPEMVLARIGELADMGFEIAIDDFGMGYSSLSYLRHFRATHIKLDRCFVQGIGEHARDEQLIGLVLQLAARWELHVVAEGVETQAALDWLRESGCTYAQGFVIARPMEAPDALAFVLGAGRAAVKNA